MPGGFKRNWWKEWLHFTPALVVSFVVPIILLVVGLRKGGLSITWQRWLLFGGIGVILWRLFVVWLKDRDELLDVWSECKFMFIHATTAWSVGGGLACILTGIYFLFTSNGSLFERYAGALGIYVSVIGASLAIHAFYRHTAPITDMDVLLRRLIEDFKEAEKESRLWIIYPALNLGYYRNRQQLRAELPDDHICKLFKKALGDCAQKLGPRRAVAITFHKGLYEKLFVCYDKMIRPKNGKPDPDCVKHCTEEALSCLRHFVGWPEEKLGFHCQILPREFPQQMVIVGDIVYSIMSYGLPIYKPNQQSDDPLSDMFHGDFHAIEGEHKPVLLLAYRRVDATLADSVSDHLRRFVMDQCQNHPWENQKLSKGATVGAETPCTVTEESETKK
jgi:hypothetical protein